MINNPPNGNINKRLLDIAKPIDTPNDFVWKDSPVEKKLLRLYDGSIMTTLDTRAYDAKQGVEYFVNMSTGNNSNDGLTPATALQTMLAAYNKTDVGTITMCNHSYFDKSMNGTVINKSISIKGYAGVRSVITTASYATWTKTAGQTNVYQKTVANAVSLMDRGRYLDNDFFPLKKVASIAICDTTVDSYYINGTTVYVHVIGDGSPPSTVQTLRSDVFALEINLTGGKTVYLENLDLVGGTHITGNGLVVSKNCTFQHGNCTTGQGGDSAYIQGSNIITIFDKCVASRAINDGFSYAEGAKSVEINCIGRNNGDGTADTQNGSTSHGGSNIIRISGEYYKNYGPNTADVQLNTQSWNINCYAHDSISPNASWDFSTNSEGHATLFLDNCKGTGSIMSLYLFSNTEAYIKDSNFVSMTNQGTITRY